MEILTFRSRFDYSRTANGIDVPVILKGDEGRQVRLWAKLDTGASLCIFQRDYAEQLGIDVETGGHAVVRTATGRYDVYGHTLKLLCLDWELDAKVYFAAPPEFSRNVLGRAGWLNRFRLGIVDHDAALYLSHYDD